jgi:hypothetical protein
MPEQGAALTVVADGKELVIAHQNLPLAEKRVCKVETGMSLDAWLNDISDVTICVLWWLARRANGEARLPYLIAEQEFDKLESIEVSFGAEDEDHPES